MKKSKFFSWSKRRTGYSLVFLLAFALTEAGRYLYRPFVYRAGFDDFGIADTMGNHLGAVTLVFFILAVMHATFKEGLIVVAVVTVGYVAYELVQRFLPGSVSDPRDVTASIVGGCLSLLLFLVIYKRGGKEGGP